MDETLNDWFVREVLPHEAALMRYLSKNWPWREDMHDLRQETYVRMYEAAARGKPVHPRSFLFSTARHLLIDRARRGRVVSIDLMGDSHSLDILVDELTPDRQMRAREELRLVARAYKRLPARCREVVWLRRVAELSQKEVARRLGIGERTVETHLMKGMKALADTLYGGGMAGEDHWRKTGKENASPFGSGHGQQAD